GRTRIGEGTTIGSGSRIEDSVVGRGCRIVASVIERSEVEEGATIGPFSHLRPGSSIGPNAEVGNYAEIKNSRLGPGVKSHHMSYLGDAEIGAGTNVGAGTITANYDGVRKLRTTIGERAFLGVHTMLRAPVTIGDGAKTGAGAIVTHDVPPGALVVGVPARVVEPHPPTAARSVEPTAAPDPPPPEAAAPGPAKPAAGGRTPAP
ncbi:MAG TPA: DapH/DapD/GlmU-related protein, partial [Candidatus Limnocylindrales bacterium]|nr:DapH/DapD/GlmU-related protein [Candidatus Limnocylindrales bacterium]